MDGIKELEQMCVQIRKDIVRAIGGAGTGHIGGSLSIVEALVCLYFREMNVDPQNPQMADRDRLVLSKGHAGPALYAVLAEKGYFDRDWLDTLNEPGTNLPSHCDMLRTPGVDMTAGSLGQGFACAVGMAKAAKACGSPARVFAVIGDGESQEGSVWEAAMFAGAHRLDNLIAFTDYNNAQISGTVTEILTLEPLEDKWRAFNFAARTVADGNDVAQVAQAVEWAKEQDRPAMIILKTVKGKGVSFAEKAGVGSHSMTLTQDDIDEAYEELEARG